MRVPVVCLPTSSRGLCPPEARAVGEPCKVNKPYETPWSAIPIKRRVESFADDLNTRRGIVSGRVALLPRSTEIQPLSLWFVPPLHFKRNSNYFFFSKLPYNNFVCFLRLRLQIIFQRPKTIYLCQVLENFVSVGFSGLMVGMPSLYHQNATVKILVGFEASQVWWWKLAKLVLGAMFWEILKVLVLGVWWLECPLYITKMLL